MHGWLSGDGVASSPNNGKARDLCVRQKSKKRVSLKEVVGQMFSDCTTTSNNRNVDPFIISAGRGFINSLTGFGAAIDGCHLSFFVCFSA
jgi:hypothetical protein